MSAPRKHPKHPGVSRQRDWQLAMRAAGRCTQCGKDAGGKALCEVCTEKKRIRMGVEPWRPGRPGRPPFDQKENDDV